jgi:integrase
VVSGILDDDDDDGYVIADALVFTGAKDAALRRSDFQNGCRWAKSVSDVGLPGLHFHDLRHTGNTLAAGTGASLADLMARMGHGRPAPRWSTSTPRTSATGHCRRAEGQHRRGTGSGT